MNPIWLTETSAGVLVTVHVQPRASRTEVSEATTQRLKIRLTAPPVDNAANEALLRFLTHLTGRPRAAAGLVRGRASRTKTIAIQGLKASALLSCVGFSADAAR